MVAIDDCKSLAAPRIRLPQKRLSILDPLLESEPWVDHCACTEKLVLFVHNHPTAVIAGTALEYASINMRLHQLRHRWPRKS